ncbi:hypothetical protein GN244_ATG07576 [Phytophthora infestans]|uniref:Uncharacterized protein n=1 Tax=Phytophthora infestans TaxID=4787 RepID=A0A833WFL1_PHYIN|nr:hypothetical protein GN244_ATG07576 [Phytophthora infestans]KAF4129418.1 hypothetical protein GN958_ATG21373 [Phytophthora infestans]
MDDASTEIATITGKAGFAVSLAKGMQFFQRKGAALYINNFALAQEKRSLTCQGKSGGNDTLYVCSTKMKCSLYVQLIMSQ